MFVSLGLLVRNKYANENMLFTYQIVTEIKSGRENTGKYCGTYDNKDPMNLESLVSHIFCAL